MEEGGQVDNRLSLIEPLGYSASTCGYCSPKGQRSVLPSSKSYGIWAHFLAPQTYECLLERGWRRSGRYIYRPDCGDQGTCCPQLAIRLDVAGFRPKRAHRRAFSSLRKSLYSSAVPLQRQDDATQDERVAVAVAMPGCSVSSLSKGKYTRTWDAEELWSSIENQPVDDLLLDAAQATESPLRRVLLARYHTQRSESGRQTDALRPPLPPQQRRLRTTLCAAQGTDEKYALFRNYQSSVHGESDEKISSRKGFERFLCESPFMPTLAGQSRVQAMSQGQQVDIAGSQPIQYGLYHLEWRLDEELVAVSVLDVLPRYLSSVYLFFDPEHAALQLGSVSAIREIALVRQLQRKRGMESMGFYTMGLYIHNCPKMRYKANFGPAQLLDPKTCRWESLMRIASQLDKGVRSGFCVEASTAKEETRETAERKAVDAEQDDQSECAEDESQLPIPPPPGIRNPLTLTAFDIDQFYFFTGSSTADRLTTLFPRLSRSKRRRVLDCVAAIGPDRSNYCLVL